MVPAFASRHDVALAGRWARTPNMYDDFFVDFFIFERDILFETHQIRQICIKFRNSLSSKLISGWRVGWLLGLLSCPLRPLCRLFLRLLLLLEKKNPKSKNQTPNPFCSTFSPIWSRNSIKFHEIPSNFQKKNIGYATNESLAKQNDKTLNFVKEKNLKIKNYSKFTWKWSKSLPKCFFVKKTVWYCIFPSKMKISF